MRFELPECRRCCFCAPLRHGILIFGYLNLAFKLFVMIVESVWVNRGGLTGLMTQTMSIYKDVAFYTEMWLTAVMYFIDVIFDLVLLFGAHTKRLKLIRAYYYYGITTALATFVMLLVVRFQSDYPEFDFMDFSLAFSAFVLQIYLLLLIRSEMIKRRYQEGSMSYCNHVSEVAVHPPAWTEGA